MIRDEIKKLLKEITGKEAKVEHPADARHGDYSTNVAMKAKLDAKKIVRKIEDNPMFEKVEVVEPGFINFWIGKKELGRLFSEFVKRGSKILLRKPEKKETIVIEYSSPNIAKPLGVHHLRSTIIGQALVDILRFVGHKVISLSFPGDWGTQFGFLIAAFKRWGNKEKIKKNPTPEMLELYVRFSQEAKKDPKLVEEGRREFKKLEEGDKENRKIWKWFLEESLEDFNQIYKLLDVRIENTIGESFYTPELKPLVRDALKRGIAERGKDGSIVIQIPESPTPEIIQKSDGATIYTTRELAAIRHRLKKWRATMILYVAANQQTFHLKQVFGAAQRLGIAKLEELFHVKFGMMLASGGKKFATREGRLIPLKEVLEEAIQRAKKIVDELNPSLPEKEKKEIARDVGIGAVKFFDLSHNRLVDIVFDWDKMLNLKGFSAPYIQYTHARLASILRKAKFKKKRDPRLTISHPLEREVMVKVLRFGEAVQDVAETYFPNKLANYLYELANILNVFYETLPVLQAKDIERDSRLNLVSGAKEILKTGLNLLGISAPERM